MLDIGEVAKATGVNASTLRYYEQQGLIRSTARNGLRGQFSNSVLDTLAIINLGKIAGFSLAEIKSMFTGSQLTIDRQMLLEKAQQLDANIKRLQVVSRGLKHVAQCPAPSHRECDKFNRIVRSASRIKVR